MINANELRMGNLIEKDNVIYKFLSLEQNHASTSEYRFYWVETLDGKLGKYYSSHFNPIPITPEILEKCGFDRNCILKISQGLNIEWSYGKEVWLTKEGEVIYEFENTQHLHQLQNLYFALTGEELTYTP